MTYDKLPIGLNEVIHSTIAQLFYILHNIIHFHINTVNLLINDSLLSRIHVQCFRWTKNFCC
jgi:hypothetical protein